MARTIEIEDNVTVGTLAEELSLPASRVIGELFKNGVVTTINERIDFDTAEIIVQELGIEDIELKKKVAETKPVPSKKPANAKSENLQSRPPVVAVMGHVDHGKTSLLDAIRGTEVVKSEAGGITQHISAYQITHNKRLITFLDTPGHEAFAAIRSHGAELTDISIIVVAADDGVKPQTIEALRFARQAGSRIIIAINKVDKEGSDSNRVKQQLAENEVMVEGWGGDTVVVEVSAKTKQGINDLLDMILLVADLEVLTAPVDVPASGLVIESHLEQGRGPVVHALVTEGILKSNSYLVAGSSYGKIRRLEATDGKMLKEAGPSTPVVISGFKSLPEFADTFNVVENEKLARTSANKDMQDKKNNSSMAGLNSSELIRIINRTNKLQELPIVVKADVQGSLTSVIDTLKSVETDEVAISVVSSGIGAINEGDVYSAHSANAIIYGFNVTAPTSIKRIANRDKVSIRLFNVIYELLDDAKQSLSDLLAPEIVEKELGQVTIKGVFKTSKTEVICGGEVTKGKLHIPAFVRVKRGEEQLAEAEAVNLKRGPQNATEVNEGEMCGISLKTVAKLDLQEEDILEFFTRESVERKL